MPPRKKTVIAPAASTDALSHEAALKRIAELEARLAVKEPEVPEATPEQLNRIQQLENALMVSRREATGARRLAATAAEEAVYEVRNVVASAISAEITDARGNQDRAMWPEKGSVQYLTASQILQIKDNYPKMFDQGYLIAPEVLPISPNVIEDCDRFIESLSFDEIIPRIKSFTSGDVLLSLYHHIENHRFRTEDETGRLYLDATGKPEVKEFPLDAKQEMVFNAIVSRVRELTGIQLSVDMSE